MENLNCYFRDQCVPKARPQQATCQVLPTIRCLGQRTFNMQMYCDSTSGYSRRIALFLSLFLGGFGADRFYLGYAMIGFLKLFTFGGIGVWSLIDVILLYANAMRPYDGSNFKDSW